MKNAQCKKCLKKFEQKGALVIGSGISGIQAALDLADAQFQVANTGLRYG